jgi:hypothetical protein
MSYAQLKFLLGPSAVSLSRQAIIRVNSLITTTEQNGQGTGYNIGAVLKARAAYKHKGGLTYSSLSNSGVSSASKLQAT